MNEFPIRKHSNECRIVTKLFTWNSVIYIVLSWPKLSYSTSLNLYIHTKNTPNPHKHTHTHTHTHTHKHTQQTDKIPDYKMLNIDTDFNLKF